MRLAEQHLIGKTDPHHAAIDCAAFASQTCTTSQTLWATWWLSGLAIVLLPSPSVHNSYSAAR
jgi:hypothetical protein